MSENEPQKYRLIAALMPEDQSGEIERQIPAGVLCAALSVDPESLKDRKEVLELGHCLAMAFMRGVEAEGS